MRHLPIDYSAKLRGKRSSVGTFLPQHIIRPQIAVYYKTRDV